VSRPLVFSLDEDEFVYHRSIFAAPGKGRDAKHKSCRWSRGLPLDGQGNPHSAANAERGKAFFGAAPLHFVQSVTRRGRRCADRMADRDRAAIDIHDRRIPAHVLLTRGLRREGFIRLDEIEILDLQPAFSSALRDAGMDLCP